MRKKITAFLTAFNFVLGICTWFPAFSVAAESGKGYQKFADADSSYGDTTVFSYKWGTGVPDEESQKFKPEEHDILITNFNVAAVGNKPTKDSTFTVEAPCKVYSLLNYHWNNAKGQTPGTIELLEDGVSIGKWDTFGTDGQGGIKNANWVALPEQLTLRPGHTYQIIDSDPDTWSQNSGSGGAGFFEIRGEVQETPVFEPGEHEIIVTNFNVAAVGNKPTKDSTFTVEAPCKVYSLLNYHWNNAKGQTPGTIELLEDGVSIGKWDTFGTDGQGGVKNANWVALPEQLTLRPGHTYQIIDSDPDTWSQNSGSGGAGFFEIRGEVQKTPVFEPGEHEIIVTNFNVAAVGNKPTKDSTFTVEAPCKVYSLLNYHWNHASGQTPGTIELLEDGVSIGKWDTFGTDGQGGVKNANWVALPEQLTLRPGHTYQILDSDPDTWSQNSGSGGAGFFEIRGEVQETPVFEPGEHEIIVTNFNVAAVGNKPTKDSTFTVEAPCKVYSLLNYHWNHASGQTPGTIELLEDGVSIGKWDTFGTDGQGGVKNANWVALPEQLTLRPGHTYQIIDSDPDTWSQNSGSGGAGFFEIRGEVQEEPEVIRYNYNTAAVTNKPRTESTFTLDRKCAVYSIMNYHWNNAKGQTPGTIELLEDGVSIGKWDTIGTDGQGGVKNANWIAYPEQLILEPGHTYTVVDSDPDTWSQNGISLGAGFFEIRGYFLEKIALHPGDINDDGGIDILDVISINKFLLGLSTPTEMGLLNADVNHNGQPDAEDALLILKFALEIINTFDPA